MGSSRLVLLLLLLLFIRINSFRFQAVEEENLADVLDLFKGLDSVLTYFRNNTDTLAQNILTTFERECFFTTEPVVPGQNDPSRRPYIVIEGNNRPSRDRVGVSLARILNGRYFNNPAPCLIRFLEELPSGSFLRRAYFVLSLYATDFNVRVQLAAGHPVVANGCWLDQLVFALEKTYQELPEVTSDLFTWPSDLLKPDMTFFLSSSLRFRGNAFTPRFSNQHQNRSLEMYRRLQRRYPIMILDRNVKPEVIHNHMIRILSHKRDLTSKDIDEDTEVRLQLFAGLQGILNFFRNNSNVLAQRILETFENECMFKLAKPIPEGGTRKPFVVLEGNGHNSRDIIGKSLARKMNARYMVHPASCLVKYMDVLPKASLLRRAYYILSLYAVSHSVKAHLSTNKAVVLNGYWHDQLTFSLAQISRPEHPIDVTSDQFRMPNELLQPDLIVYLLADIQSLAENRASASVYASTLEMYKSLQAFYPIVIEELTGDDRTTTANVFKHVQERLSETRHIVEQEYDEVTDVLHLFTGLAPVVDYFKQSTHPFAKEIVTTFEQYWTSSIQEPDNVPRKPFIVVEGNNRTSRDAISFRLSKMLGGVFVKHPAPCLRDFMYTLPSGSLLRRAYYLLSLYATSLDVKRQTRITPVVVNGFWLDQLTFALIQSFQYGRLPRVTTPIYRWPLELLRPDFIFYLNHPDHLDQQPFIKRSHNNWKPRSLELYRKLTSLYNVTIVNVQQDYWNTTDKIYKSIIKIDIPVNNEAQDNSATT